MRYKFSIISLLHELLGHIEINRNLLVLLELHDQEWISRLTLSERGIESNTDHEVQLVWLWQNHELLDVVILNLVVVRLTTKSERCLVHIDIETTSANCQYHPPKIPR